VKGVWIKKCNKYICFRYKCQYQAVILDRNGEEVRIEKHRAICLLLVKKTPRAALGVCSFGAGTPSQAKTALGARLCRVTFSLHLPIPEQAPFLPGNRLPEREMLKSAPVEKKVVILVKSCHNAIKKAHHR